MIKATAEGSPLLKARVAGTFYLLNILTIFTAVFLFRGLPVSGDPASTVRNLLAHEALFRLAVAFEVISTACSIGVAALFYELFISVNKSLSLLAACFRLVACAIAVIGYLFQLAPLQILGGGQSLSGLRSDEVPAIALLFDRLHGPASDMVIVFFGFHFLLIGLLILKSTFLPRILGVFCEFGALGCLILLAPPLANYLFPYILGAGFLTEVSLTLWLLLKGVNVQRWKEQASTAGEW